MPYSKLPTGSLFPREIPWEWRWPDWRRNGDNNFHLGVCGILSKDGGRNFSEISSYLNPSLIRDNLDPDIIMILDIMILTSNMKKVYQSPESKVTFSSVMQIYSNFSDKNDLIC